MSGTPQTRVLVVGLDMGDGDLIRRWTHAKRLPHFAALESSGAWLDIGTPAEVLRTSTWPTFATGTLPGRHGVYYPYQPKPGSQLAQHVDAGQYGRSTFWKLAADEGRRSIVYDIPETFPEPAFNGRAIFDWGTWAWYGEPAGQPSDLLGRLKSRFGPYPLGLEAKRLGLRWPPDIEQRLLGAIRYKQLTAEWLLGRADWDLAVVGFCETHPAGHYLWPSGVEGLDAGDEMAFEPLFRIYAAVDQALGALLAGVSSDVTVVVTSGDGVRPNRCGWHLLPAVLQRLGYTAPGAVGGDQSATTSPSPISRLHGLVPAAARQLVTNALPWRLRDRLGVWIQTRSIDWSRTRAFTLPTDLEGCIRINLKGREPFGIVEPGAQYHDLCNEMRLRLEELVNADTGAPTVRRVWLRDEVFPGPRREQLPDIIVTWNDAAPIRRVASPRVGLVEGVNPDPRPGTHSPHGFVLAHGGRISEPAPSGGSLVDVAPTVLRLLGMTGARDFDGKALNLAGRSATEDPVPPATMETQ